jgi:hypothetical protein
MNLSSLLPSRLTVILAAVCLFAVPVSVVSSYQWGVKNRDAVREQKRADGLDKELNAPIVGVRAQLTACSIELGNAKTAIDTQNSAVDALKAEADARDARAREAVSAAQNRARTAERRVQALLQSSPREGETPCVAAERVIREQLG